MASLLDLAKRIETMDKEFAKKANELSIEGAKILLHDLLDTTPVDTSKATSNWQVSIGTNQATEREAFVLGTQGSSRAASVDAAYAEGAAKLNDKKAGETIYISNLAPYIIELNRGSSRQAPALFIEACVARWQNWLKGRK